MMVASLSWQLLVLKLVRATVTVTLLQLVKVMGPAPELLLGTVAAGTSQGLSASSSCKTPAASARWLQTVGACVQQRRELRDCDSWHVLLQLVVLCSGGGQLASNQSWDDQAANVCVCVFGGCDAVVSARSEIT